MSHPDDVKNEADWNPERDGLNMDDWSHVKNPYADRPTDKPVDQWIKEVVTNEVKAMDLADRKAQVDGTREEDLERHRLSPSIHCIMQRHPNGGLVLRTVDGFPHGIGHVGIRGETRELCEARLYQWYANQLTQRRIVVDRIQALEFAANSTFNVHEV